MNNKLNYVGIDNGLAGGVAVLNEQGAILLKAPMPTIKIAIGKRLKNRVDVRGLCKMLQPFAPFTAGLESYAGSKSINAAVSMADSYARIESALLLMGTQPASVISTTWQKVYWTKPKRGEQGHAEYNTKHEALKVANELWPSVQFFATRRSTTPHDGIVDGLLIAEYMRRNNN
jgi:hypothetical protein